MARIPEGEIERLKREVSPRRGTKLPERGVADGAWSGIRGLRVHTLNPLIETGKMVAGCRSLLSATRGPSWAQQSVEVRVAGAGQAAQTTAAHSRAIGIRLGSGRSVLVERVRCAGSFSGATVRNSCLETSGRTGLSQTSYQGEVTVALDPANKRRDL